MTHLLDVSTPSLSNDRGLGPRLVRNLRRPGPPSVEESLALLKRLHDVEERRRPAVKKPRRRAPRGQGGSPRSARQLERRGARLLDALIPTLSPLPAIERLAQLTLPDWMPRAMRPELGQRLERLLLGVIDDLEADLRRDRLGGNFTGLLAGMNAAVEPRAQSNLLRLCTIVPVAGRDAIVRHDAALVEGVEALAAGLAKLDIDAFDSTTHVIEGYFGVYWRNGEIGHPAADLSAVIDLERRWELLPWATGQAPLSAFAAAERYVRTLHGRPREDRQEALLRLYEHGFYAWEAGLHVWGVLGLEHRAASIVEEASA